MTEINKGEKGQTSSTPETVEQKPATLDERIESMETSSTDTTSAVTTTPEIKDQTKAVPETKPIVTTTPEIKEQTKTEPKTKPIVVQKVSDDSDKSSQKTIIVFVAGIIIGALITSIAL